MDNLKFKKKYLKYKLKYTNFKKKIGGMMNKSQMLAFILSQRENEDLVRNPDLLQSIASSMSDQYANISYDSSLGMFLSKSNMDYVKKFPDILNSENRAQYIIVKNQLLGERPPPPGKLDIYSEINSISKNLYDLIRIEKKIIEGIEVKDNDKTKYAILKPNESKYLNIINKWTKFKEFIEENYDFYSNINNINDKFIVLKKNLIDSIN